LGWLSVFSRLLPQIFCRRARAWGTKFLSMPWEARVDLSHRALQHDHCAGLLPGDCVRFVGGTLVVIVVVDISTSGRAVLTAIGPSGVRRYRIRLLGGTDNQTHRPRRIGLCARDGRHDGQRGSAGGEMQKISAGKFHGVHRTSRLAEYHAVARVTSRLRRRLRPAKRAPAPESVRPRSVNSHSSR